MPPRPLLEEVFVDFLEVQDLLDPASDIVPDHQTGEMFAAFQGYVLAQIVEGLSRVAREARYRDEQVCGGLVPVEAEGVLVDHTIDAVIALRTRARPASEAVPPQSKWYQVGSPETKKETRLRTY